MGNGSSRDQEDLFDNEVNLFQFKLLRVIGRGSFGKVRMVERRETGKIYALKYISKAQVIKMDAVRNILRERQILETLDHAFVVNMRFAFQDDEYMYMCMDLMMGGDLRFHLNRKQFGEDVVRFWIAELCLAVTHLHSQGIVHRDIKPDNVLLDEKGHAHLTDFNIGCKLTPEKPFLTSQSGTVAYMAPEVFKGSGYGTSIDWWALGVVFYECIYGRRPFQTENLNDLKRAIPTQTIDYPEKDGLSRECISAMRGFLTRDPKERLGVKGGMEEIRHHPFFQKGAYQSNLDNWWYMLETKQLTPKFQPSSENANFDATYDLEELLLDDEPLTYRSTRKRAQRKQKEKDKALKEENARLKAEHEAAAAAAELAMSAMTLSAEDYYNNSGSHHPYNRDGGYQQPQQQQQITHPSRNEKPVGEKQLKLMKKRSKVYLGGAGGGKDSDNSNSSSTNSSHVHLSQPSAMTQPYLQQQQQQPSPPVPPIPQSHTTSSYANAQFQSTQASSPESGGRQGMPIPLPPPPLPSLSSSASPALSSIQFPSPPPPSVTRQSGQHVRHNTNSFYSRHHLGTSLPPPPTQSPPLIPSLHNQSQQSQHQYSTSTSSSSKPSIDHPKANVTIAAAAAAGPGSGKQNGSTVSGYSYSTAGGQSNHGVTAIYLSKPVVSSSKTGGTPYPSSYSTPSQFQYKSKQSYSADDDLVNKSYPGSTHPTPFQQQQQQQDHQQYPSTSTSSSSSMGGGGGGNSHPLPHPLPSRTQFPPNTPVQKNPQAQPQQPAYQPHPQPYNQQQYQTPIQRQNSPATTITNSTQSNATTVAQAVAQHHQQQQQQQQAAANARAAAEAAAEAEAEAVMASGNMTRKEKIAYQMALIDREFTTFDYTVYESYNGLVDPLTMSVGDPPEWVRSRDY